VLDLARVRQGVGGDDLVRQAADEGLLIAGTLEVAVLELLALTHERQRLIAVQHVLALGEGVAVLLQRLLGIHGHPAETVGQRLEALDVDDRHVIEIGDDEVRDRRHGQRQTSVGHVRVDLRLTMALAVDPRAARDRHDLDGAAVLRQVHDHDRVRAQTAGGVDVDLVHRFVGAEQQDVRAVALLAAGLLLTEDLFIGELVRVLVERATHVPDVEADAQYAEDDDDEQHDEALAPYALLLARSLLVVGLVVEEIVEGGVVRHRHSGVMSVRHSRRRGRNWQSRQLYSFCYKPRDTAARCPTEVRRLTGNSARSGWWGRDKLGRLSWCSTTIGRSCRFPVRSSSPWPVSSPACRSQFWGWESSSSSRAS